MYEMLAALNAALMPMSLAYMYFFMQFQYRVPQQSREGALFSWALLQISIGIFFSSLLFFLWDFDVIFKSTQYKLSVIPRGFFLTGLTTAFIGLDFPWKRTLLIFSSCLFFGVLVARILA